MRGPTKVSQSGETAGKVKFFIQVVYKPGNLRHSHVTKTLKQAIIYGHFCVGNFTSEW